MSGNGEKAKPVSLREDLDLSESSSEDEAAVAVRPEEAAMDQDEAPPAEPETGTRAATAADTAPDDRPPAEVARTESTPTYACSKCSYASTSKSYLTTHVRRRHTDEDVMWQCKGCQQAYDRSEFVRW